jgi:glycosyltransferase involved in cell wall biosynthesis
MISPKPAAAQSNARAPKVLYLVAEDWYFVSHRLHLASAVRRAGFDVVVATRVHRHADCIERAGLKLRPLSFDRASLNPLTDLRTLLGIAAIYREERPDIVHHVALKPVIYGSIIARLLGIGGIVNAFGGLGYVFSSSGFRAKLLHLLIRPPLKIALGGRRSRVIVQNSDDFRRIVAEGLTSPGHVTLIRGAGVDIQAYRQVEPSADVPLVVLPARLLREKGVEEFVEAARRLRSEGIEARFALVGSPDPANPSSVRLSEIAEWVEEGAIEYWGWRDNMPEVFSKAQIVCLPTYYMEGLPKSLLEAAAAGCAIVTTDNPGCREVIEAGVSGWVVPMKDLDALVAALRQAIDRADLRKQYGIAARKLVVSGFSSQQVSAETIAVYREILAPPGQQSPSYV